ncbi:bifunctional diaminohydroxyphosphoribosylaminopyrimidine deaminase/5-amino-6-(5-phosphoribosylamino)uracil reductase RibD [Candidatus Pelagibacter sp. Uisw_134_02]|uniref:bifunctional diaminohydroxyphosphoribosylaminopyrimidine deaminase/5-amino-6-(5-phosphoribosylamino)uracil reductase RibD n=1 Tax=Candidatus Pelagibacter sp. Uisw_134_02 TaxID=3230990 RepID=UPI0039E9CD2D
MSTKKDKFTKKDKTYMELALNLARARHGHTGINPSVGCVIVKNDKIISIGQTNYNGRPHAEYNAIINSDENLTDSKMYVTLEPCNHYGKTPPCTNLIIKKKIKEVIYSIDDIDKKVKGKSFKILKSKNIIVKKGLLKKDVGNFYLTYFFNRKNKLPFVTGKIATSKNNVIYNNKSKRITDKHSDKLTHFLRYKNDAIMISYKTLNKDNPKLNCRLSGLEKFSPKRIILDNNLNTKIDSYIFNTADKENTIIFYNNANKHKITLFKKKGIKLIKSKLTKIKYFDLKIVLKKLYRIGIRNILVEGGNGLSGSFLKNKLLNQFYLFKSPKILTKSVPYKDFDHSKHLIHNYRIKSKISNKLTKDTITLYKN